MFGVNVDMSQLADLANLEPTLKKIASEAGEELSKMAVAKAKEKAAEKLHTRRQMYQDALSYVEESDGVWVIHLDKKVRWIDDGQTPFDMLKTLLASPKAKTGKNGKYIVIPFDHSPGGRGGKGSKIGRTEAGQDLVNAVKKELKAKRIPFDKIEKDSQGNDLTGKLHGFSITNAPFKKVGDNGPGQRRGPVGEVYQGAKEKGASSGIPFLQGVSIYQHKDQNGKTQRSIMTFRVASEKPGGVSRWEHPGNDAVEILEKAVEEAVDIWQREVAPALIDAALSKS